MISQKVLINTVVIALTLTTALPSDSFARPPGRPGGGARPGAVAPFRGGAPGPRYGGGYRGGGFVPGVVAGGVIGGAIVAPGYGYYAPGTYYAPGYYDPNAGDDAVEVAPNPGGDDAVAWCMQTYRSYDPASGTYVGYDGLRHPCP